MQRVALLLLVLATSLPSIANCKAFAAETIVINEAELNPPGTDSHFEQVELYNPTNEPIDIGGWSISSTAGRTVTVTIDDGTYIPASAHLLFGSSTQWLDNSGEVIVLRNSAGAAVDSAGPFSDEDNDARTWQRSPDGSNNWIYAGGTLGGPNQGTSVPEPKPEPEPLPGQPPTEPPVTVLPEPSPPSGGSELNLGEDEMNQELMITFIEVGQGDSTLIISPNNSTLLIDGGERENSDELLVVLQELGITRIDVMVATHPHEDHIGGLVEVLETLDVGQVIDSGQVHTTQTFEDFLDAIDAAQIPLTSAREGDSIELDPEIMLEVLNPPVTLVDGQDDEEKFNDNSVVIKLTYGEFTALFTGDMEETSESWLQSTRGEDLDSDVLKVGHHGSSTSSTDSFLGAVSPEVAIISVGANNSYGHPHEETLNRITAAGTLHVLRTDLNGTITITTSGSSEYTIDTSSKTVTVPEFEIALAIASGAFSAIIVTRVRIWKWQQA